MIWTGRAIDIARFGMGKIPAATQSIGSQLRTAPGHRSTFRPLPPDELVRQGKRRIWINAAGSAALKVPPGCWCECRWRVCLRGGCAGAVGVGSGPRLGRVGLGFLRLIQVGFVRAD